jgi:hypothetical protein
VEMQPKEWEKILAKYISEKRSISTICKELNNLAAKK